MEIYSVWIQGNLSLRLNMIYKRQWKSSVREIFEIVVL
jgi:hypothetical protein